MADFDFDSLLTGHTLHTSTHADTDNSAGLNTARKVQMSLPTQLAMALQGATTAMTTEVMDTGADARIPKRTSDSIDGDGGADVEARRASKQAQLLPFALSSALCLP